MVALDATFLLLFLNPEAKVPGDGTGQPVRFAAERIQHLVEELDKLGVKIIVPTPALSEVLVNVSASESQTFVEAMSRRAIFRIESFDVRAAIEVATMSRLAIGAGNKKGTSESPWAKVKYDRQIVAIAKVNQASAIYSDDQDVRAIAGRTNIEVFGLADLPLPPKKQQHELELRPPGK